MQSPLNPQAAAAAPARSARERLSVKLFIAAQIGIPIVATLHRWLTGRESWWGWQMFSF